MNNSCWLPPLEECPNIADWTAYQELLYSIFKADFLDSFPRFSAVRVGVKHYPMEFGKEEAFFHITCKDYEGGQNRVPDLRRCERIRWVRAFIENNCDSSKCENCEGIKTWEEPYKSKTRVHILLPEERYMVVLEHRPKTEMREAYYLLITAFYLEYDHALEKQLRHYEMYKK